MLHVLTTKASKKRLDVNPNCSNFSDINPPDKKVKDDNYTVIFFFPLRGTEILQGNLP